MTTNYQLGDRQARGKEEMRALAVTTFTALEDGNLTDLLEFLQERVFDRPPADVMDVELVEGVWEWRFKPYIELLLCHIAATAGNRAISHADQRTDIEWAVEMAGC